MVRNCLTYALDKWRKEGGYVKIRKSLAAMVHNVSKWHLLNLVPHFLHETQDGEVTQLVPNDEEEANVRKRGPWAEWLMLLHFKGKVVSGDECGKQSEPYPVMYALVVLFIAFIIISTLFVLFG